MITRALPRCSALNLSKSNLSLRHSKFQACYLPQRSSKPCNGIETTRLFVSLKAGSPMLGQFRETLDKIAPRFDINVRQISVLDTPTDFYKHLKVRTEDNFSKD